MNIICANREIRKDPEQMDFVRAKGFLLDVTVNIAQRFEHGYKAVNFDSILTWFLLRLNFAISVDLNLIT